jgi:hypothetical protein
VLIQEPGTQLQKKKHITKVIIRIYVKETQTNQTEQFNNCVTLNSGKLIIMSISECKLLPSEDI